MQQGRTTDALIASLAAARVPRPFSPVLVAALVLGGVGLGVGLWLSLMGVRADLAAALLYPVTSAKTLVTALLALGALWLAGRSGYPGRRVGTSILLAPLLVAALLLASALAVTPGPLVAEAVMGKTAIKCLAAVLAMSVLPLAGGLTALGKGASTRPALSGALVGLAAGAGAAAGYSLACTEDSPLFYVVWYGLAICTAAGIGALLGLRLLRW